MNITESIINKKSKNEAFLIDRMDGPIWVFQMLCHFGAWKYGIYISFLLAPEKKNNFLRMPQKWKKEKNPKPRIKEEKKVENNCWSLLQIFWRRRYEIKCAMQTISWAYMYVASKSEFKFQEISWFIDL